MTAFLFGIACSIIAVVVIVILPNEPILNWWFRFGYKVGIYTKQGQEHDRWFYRPIWGCEKCFAGQLALWGYMILTVRAEMGVKALIFHGCIVWLDFRNYGLFWHVAAICTAVLFAVLFSLTIKKLTNEN